MACPDAILPGIQLPNVHENPQTIDFQQATFWIYLQKNSDFNHLSNSILPNLSQSKLKCLLQIGCFEFSPQKMKEPDVARGQLHAAATDSESKSCDGQFLGDSVCGWDTEKAGKPLHSQIFPIPAHDIHPGHITPPLFSTWCPKMHHTWWCLSRLPAPSPGLCITSHFVHPCSCSWPAFPTLF